MNWRITKDRYGSLSIGLHWLMLLLLAVHALNCVSLYPKETILVKR